ncbi:MAG: hypothetical protein M3387_10935 [Actinomycetota bacterium]|nr:hypothetical protein [Actinomycetota bacterium]
MAADEVDTLFTLVPDEFTAARDGLVKRLRAAGEREAAKTVAGLRRPKLAAWAVNHLVRCDRAAVEALLEAGAAVREQQRRLLSGAKAPQLRAVSAARRAAIEELVAKAVAALAQHGVNPQAHVGEITATLEAASADEQAARQVLAGRLSSPLAAPSGFGDLSGLSLVVSEDDLAEEPGTQAAGQRPSEEAADQQRGAAQRQPAGTQRRAQQAQRERDKERERQRRQAEAALNAARAAADEAEAQRQGAQEEVGTIDRKVDTARDAAEEAEAAAVAARRDADRLLGVAAEATARANEARASLERLEEQAAATRRTVKEAERALDQLD